MPSNHFKSTTAADVQDSKPAVLLPPPTALQEDNFIPAMTARETLCFYADISLPLNSRAGRSQRVEEVLAAVGLAAAANTLVRWYCIEAHHVVMQRCSCSRWSGSAGDMPACKHR
jgi:hypothetical protein